MPPGHWLVKSEPFKYAWDQLVDDGRTLWDGVRNYEARNNLQAMKVGDLVLYYHSNEGKEVVGVARVVREAYSDPTTDDPAWVVVDVEPVQRLEEPVSLAAVKAEPALAEMALIKRGRISVVAVTAGEFERVLAMGRTTLRAGAVAEKLPPRETPRSARATGERRKAGVKRSRPKERSSPTRAAGRKSAAGRKGTRRAPKAGATKGATKKRPKKKAAKRRAKNASRRTGRTR